MAAARGAKLAESNRLQEFFRELDDEDAWIKEKKILVTSDDFGKDLTGIQNLRKKHKRFEQELASKENTIQVGLSKQLRSHRKLKSITTEIIGCIRLVQG